MKEKEELILVKPEFKNEISAKVVSLGEIEDNISEVKDFALALSDYYKNVKFTPNTMKEATDEKAKINKFKDKVAEYRKNIVAEYKKPIELFETTAKNTEKILKDTYELINVQVQKYNDETKAKIKELSVSYFNEYALSKNVDFITYEQTNINITLGLITPKGELTKKAKDDITTFIDKICDELNLIDTQEHKAEILVEYKQSLNVAQAITTVSNRFKAIEEEKKRQEELAKIKEQEQATVQKVEEVVKMEAPTVENKNVSIGVDLAQGESVHVEETIYTMSFYVRGNKTQLKAIKQFLEEGGYDYGSIK